MLKPFQLEIVNVLYSINECTLGALSLIQAIFTTDAKEVRTVIIVGWSMISMMITMVGLNYFIVIGYSV